MTTKDDKNIPSWREQVLVRPGSINLFITICDYDEEKYDDDDNDDKDTRPNFCPNTSRVISFSYWFSGPEED